MALTAGFLKQTAADTWPCGPGLAQHAVFEVSETGTTRKGAAVHETRFSHRAQVDSAQIQDIGDHIADLIKLQQEHHLDLNLWFELTAAPKDSGRELKEEAKTALKQWLDGVGL